MSQVAVTLPATLAPASARGAALRRRIGAAVALAAAALLGLAAWLEPSPTGVGTHAQLFLAPCSWIVYLDIPCPTCGMTTAFAYAADGDLPRAFAAQPMGCLLALATGVALLAGAHAAATGSALSTLFARLWSGRAAWALGAGVAAAWAYKVVAWKGWLG